MALRLSLMARPHWVPGGDVRLSLDVARAADDAGFHSFQFGEHQLIGNRPEMYPYGPFAHVKDVPWLDPFVTLGWIAAATKRIRLSTSILLAPLRPAVQVAKSLATLDVLSSGRAEFGLGVGWQPEEYEAAGVPWDKRYSRFEEVVSGCRAIWGEQPVTFEAPGQKLDAAYCYPLPVQKRIPLLFGLKMTPKNADRVARLGDGWCPPSAYGPAQVREGADVLKSVLEAQGRSLSEMLIRAHLAHVKGADGQIDIPASFAPAGELLEIGANILAINTPPNPGSMGEITRFIEGCAREAERY